MRDVRSSILPGIVVFHSAVFPYVTQERRVAFAERLADLSHRRDVVWISNEAAGVVPGLALPAIPQGRVKSIVGRRTFTDGMAVDEVLAVAHPHGSELT
jgi:hypothetical protein